MLPWILWHLNINLINVLIQTDYMQPHKRTQEISLSSIKLVELFIDMLARECVVTPYDKAKMTHFSSVNWLPV